MISIALRTAGFGLLLALGAAPSFAAPPKLSEFASGHDHFAGLVTDLHKGKSEGVVWSRGWSLVIDAVCALTIVMSATGVYLWWSLKSRGRYGLPLIALGILASFAVCCFTIR